MILCLRTPPLSLVAAWQRSLSLRGRPLVLGGLAHQRLPVLAASDEARAAGVEKGMPLREAQQRCPEAVFQPVDAEAVAHLQRELVATLYRFTPQVQPPDDDGVVFLQLGGLHLKWPDPMQLLGALAKRVQATLGVVPTMGLGANLFISRLAADRATPGKPVLVEAGQAARFLQPLPITCLPLDEEMRVYLELLGLKTLGALQQLSRAAWQRQFGAKGVVLHDLAAGIDPRRLDPWHPPARVEATTPLEPPLENIEALQFVVRALTDRLSASLIAQGLGTRRLLIVLYHDSCSPVRITSPFTYPASAATELFGSARPRLLKTRPPAPIERITLSARQLEPAYVRQPGLLLRRDGHRESLADAIARLQEEYRPELVQRVLRLPAAPPLATRQMRLVPA